MKANAPKRKVFQDALDLLAEDPVKDTPVAVNGIVSIPVEGICMCLLMIRREFIRSMLQIQRM